MKIAFCGASGTGKTTLATALSNKLHLPLLTNRARSIAELLHITDLYNINPTKRALYQHAIILSQIEQELRVNDCGFVSDRSVVDILMYWMLDNSENYPLLTKNYWNLIFFYKKYHPYDLLIYLPIEFEAENDGFRYTGKHLIAEDEFIKNFIAQYGRDIAKQIISVSGDLGKRLAQIEVYINGK